MIFYFSFIRCYLYYFVKLQIDFKDLGDLSQVHQNFYGISNSSLGKIINLYIAKIFILNGKREYFLDKYLKDEEQNNWKNSIISANNKKVIFPIEDYENYKYLLFDIWSNINNDSFNQDLIQKLGISDLYYLLCFSLNEINYKRDEDKFENSELLIKLNEMKEGFNIDLAAKTKINQLIEVICDLDFFKDKDVKKNLSCVFNAIKLYILGFIGCENNLLFSSIFSDNIIHLIKLFYKDNLKNEMILIESFYQMKKYLEIEYLKKKI